MFSRSNYGGTKEGTLEKGSLGTTRPILKSSAEVSGRDSEGLSWRARVRDPDPNHLGVEKRRVKSARWSHWHCGEAQPSTSPGTTIR